MDKIYILKECVENITKDAYKFFEKKNKAAGVRARKKLQKCKIYAQEIRNLIQRSKNEYAQKKATISINTLALNAKGFLCNQSFGENKNQKIPLSITNSSALFFPISDKKSVFLSEKNQKKPDTREPFTQKKIKKVEEVSPWDINLNVLK